MAIDLLETRESNGKNEGKFNLRIRRNERVLCCVQLSVDIISQGRMSRQQV